MQACIGGEDKETGEALKTVVVSSSPATDGVSVCLLARPWRCEYRNERVMDELSESTHRRTPSFPHAGGQSPRVGGCVGKFYELFDWNLTKRYSSTKRITAGTRFSALSSASSPHPLSTISFW